MQLKQIFIIVFFFFKCCLSLPLIIIGQNISMVDSMLAHGDSLFAQEKLEEAGEAFKAVLKIDRDLIQAYAGLGKIAVAQEKWGDARDEFGRVLDRDQGNIEANYFKAICYREIGKFKALLLRKIDWDKAKKHFTRVLDLDSLFNDVVYQYALLKRYQENYKEAIQLGHAQTRLKPRLVEPQVKLFRFYRYFIRHTKRDEALNWLKKQPGDHAIWGIAEKLRREGDLIKADSVLFDLLNHPLEISRQPIYLSLTKIYYEQNFRDKAEDYFWRAINEIQNDIDANLVFEDVKYILTDQELASYQSMYSTKEKINFYKILWISRDPAPAASTNYRLGEHYQRLIFAEKHYEFDGFRTWFNNPDKFGYLDFTETYNLNEEFDDMGLIYIRHGNYDDWAITAGDDMPSNQSWLYHKTESTPKLVFHFFLENTAGYWRFSPIVTDPRMLEDRLQFGNIYYRMLRATAMERIACVEEMANESRGYVSTGLSTDRHTWDKKIKPLETPFLMSTFRGENGKTVLEVYNAFSLSEIAKEIKAENIEIEKGIAIHNMAWQEVEKHHEKMLVPVRKGEWFIDLYRFEVQPDPYHIAFYLRPRETDFLGGWKFEKQVPSYSSTKLCISDIELATRIEPATKPGKFEKNGLIVVPNPTRLFNIEHLIYIYFEIYHLTQDFTGNTSFIIEYTMTLLERKQKGLLGLFGGKGKSSISTQVEREGRGERSVEYLAIDVSQLKAGEYELTVKVTDRHNKKTTVQKRKIALK